AAYDYNRNFGRPGVVIPSAPFRLIFNFTGSGRPQPFAGDTTVLPFNWVIEWDRFTDKGDSQPDHFARKIDTQLAPPLFDMINQITPAEQALPAATQDILKRPCGPQPAARLPACAAHWAGGRHGPRGGTADRGGVAPGQQP